MFLTFPAEFLAKMSAASVAKSRKLGHGSAWFASDLRSLYVLIMKVSEFSHVFGFIG